LVERHELCSCLAEDYIAVFSQFVQVVEQVYVKEFWRQLLGKSWLDSEMKLSVAQFENAMTFVVVDQCAVVELSGT
jgi:hypothetical protein